MDGRLLFAPIPDDDDDVEDWDCLRCSPRPDVGGGGCCSCDSFSSDFSSSWCWVGNAWLRLKDARSFRTDPWRSCSDVCCSWLIFVLFGPFHQSFPLPSYFIYFRRRRNITTVLSLRTHYLMVGSLKAQHLSEFLSHLWTLFLFLVEHVMRGKRKTLHSQTLFHSPLNTSGFFSCMNGARRCAYMTPVFALFRPRVYHSFLGHYRFNGEGRMNFSAYGNLATSKKRKWQVTVETQSSTEIAILSKACFIINGICVIAQTLLHNRVFARDFVTSHSPDFWYFELAPWKEKDSGKPHSGAREACLSHSCFGIWSPLCLLVTQINFNARAHCFSCGLSCPHSVLPEKIYDSEPKIVIQISAFDTLYAVVHVLYAGTHEEVVEFVDYSEGLWLRRLLWRWTSKSYDLRWHRGSSSGSYPIPLHTVLNCQFR